MTNREDESKMEHVGTLQSRVQPWMMACFGPEISADKIERNDRFIEEALELVQASDYPKERALALVDYVYGRDKGEINQEVGGVMITLAAHCLAHGVDMHEAGETELARIWTKVEKIRAKQAAKPTGSALPIAAPSQGERVEQDTAAQADVVAQFLPTEDGEFNGNEQPEATEVDDLAAARKWLSARWSVEHPNEGHVKQLAEYAASLRAPAPQPTSTLSPHIEGENDGGGR